MRWLCNECDNIVNAFKMFLGSLWNDWFYPQMTPLYYVLNGCHALTRIKVAFYQENRQGADEENIPLERMIGKLNDAS